MWLESFDTKMPFYFIGDNKVDVLQNNSNTASYTDFCSSFSCELLNGEYDKRETETTASFIDHHITNSCNETSCISLIKCDLTYHHGLHHIISFDSKTDEENNTRYQRDVSKINDAHYVCQFLFRLLSDFQNVAYEHQSFNELATDVVSKLKNDIELYFSIKQISKQHESFILPRMIKNAIQQRHKILPEKLQIEK